MKIAIFGAGAVGGYFGGLLHRAGFEVSFIARGAHGAAMRERGLQLVLPQETIHLTGLRVTDDAASLPPQDITLLCVKAYAIEAAAGFTQTLG
jgi:2-dehydropantoate 2-reductase